jgi:transcription antitermination factor NusG
MSTFTSGAELSIETAPSEQWYALYTCSRHEKQVAAQLEQRGLEFFLPLYASVRRWKDRRVELDLPLFPGYVFVHIPLRERVRVLQVPGAVHFVAFQGTPSALAAEDVERLRNGLRSGVRAEPHPYLTIGRRVRVVRGPLTGMQGILLRRKERFRLVLSIELIMRSVAVEVDACDVEPASFSRVAALTDF